MLAEDRITRGVKPKRTRRDPAPSAEDRGAALRRLFGMDGNAAASPGGR